MEENKYPFELLNTTVFLTPEDIIAYHLYKSEYYKKINNSSLAERELEIVKSYKSKILIESEEKVCLKK